MQLGVAHERPGVNMTALLDDAARDRLCGKAELGRELVAIAPA